MALADDDGRSEPFDAPRPDPADGAVAAAPTTARAPPALAEGAVVPVRFDASSVALAAGSEGLESRCVAFLLPGLAARSSAMRWRCARGPSG